MYGSYKSAGNTDEFLISNTPSHTGPNHNPRDMFRTDQIFNASVQENQFVVYQNKQLYVGYVWPIGEIVNEKGWLEEAFEATGAVGLAAMLFIYHKEHKMMDYIPSYLSNPGFMDVHGDKLKETLTKFMSGHVRNDILFRYQRLLQTSPIMFETMSWLDAFHQDTIGTKMYRFGIPNAFPFIKPENITAEMIYEAITNARVNAAKRLVPPGPLQFIEMYAQLLQHDGHDLVNFAELVQIALLDWRLAYSYIKVKELSFNDALSIMMTFVYKRGNDVSAGDNYSIFEKLFNDYGPSDQWPSLLNVIAYVDATTGGKVGIPTQSPTHQPASTLDTPQLKTRALFE